MKNLKDLIEELCPNGVPYMSIGDFCDVATGKGITKKDASIEGIYPIISGGKEPMGFYDKTNRPANTVTISRVGANAGFVSFIEQDFYLNDKCFSVIPQKGQVEIDEKYLYYVLKNIENAITDMQSEGGVPTINTTKVKSIRIPVPPIEIQREIIHILDNFTLLISELSAELIDRQKQYEYYRDKLIAFKEL